MQIGFTGTRQGMTEAQKLAVADLLTSFEFVERVHHGCCVGAHAQFHELVLKHRGEQSSVLIHGHPSNLPERYQIKERCDETETAKPPLKRNHDIVNAADVMFAVVVK